MPQQVLTITQVNEYIRTLMDGDQLLLNLAVKGEISNYKIYPSGHHYFTLKDETGVLKCVMFKGNAMKIRFRPENGMKVIAMGKISVYPRDGAYQLYCTGLVLDGVGDLYAAFEQLKVKLAAQGMFDQSHKKPLPPYPNTIGIVTSSAGAAVHDMLRIIRKRYPLAWVLLLPVRVQGAEAPGEIVAAIQYANHYSLADLLIVGRGGGSIEDLWAFNDERVAYAIYKSRIPIISAVGHEPDVTISDFVADLRAATPSNAAELAVPDREALSQTLDRMSETMASAITRQLRINRQRLKMLSLSPVIKSMDGYLNQRKNELNILRGRLISAENQHLSVLQKRFVNLTAKLDAMSPLKVLSRGYAMVQDEKGGIVHSFCDVTPGDQLRISLEDGAVTATVNHAEAYQNV